MRLTYLKCNLFERYKIELLSDQRLIILDFQFNICLERNICDPVVYVFKSQVLPIPLCVMNMEFKTENVSLVSWMRDKGFKLGQSLTTALGNELLDSLGLTNFMNAKQCNRFEGIYARSVNGWNYKDCPVIMSLPRIHSSITCHVSELCTGMTCCIEVGKIKKTFTAFIMLDYCHMELSIGIERKVFEMSLRQYKWGQKEMFTLMNVIRLEFNVYDLVGENVYLLNMNISVCLEVEGPCLIHIPILKNTKLPKHHCNWSKDLNTKGFSLKQFKSGKNIGSAVNNLDLKRLIEELGIAKHLKDEQCNHLTGPFVSVNSSGWNNECKQLQSNTLTTIRGPVSCHITELCTRVECCVEVVPINRTVFMFLDVDTCNYQMSVGIENLVFNISLLHYEFGNADILRMGEVATLEYSIDDLKGKHMLLLNIDLKICFERDGSCILRQQILKEALLPKPVCNLDNGFSKLDFSLATFSLDFGVNGLPLPQYVVDLFLEQLGVTKFLESPPCNRMVSPYSPGKRGWNNACRDKLPLPRLNGPVSCHITSSCSGIECCLDVKPLQRSFHAYVLLDACSNRIKLGIENYNLDTVYFDFKFGMGHRVSFGKMLVMDYSIHNFLGEKKYLINLNISVCLEVDQCSVRFAVLEDMFLPYSICNWNKSMSDFSMQKFLRRKGLPEFVQQLPDTFVLQILEKRRITEYLQSPQCKTNDPIYQPSRNGWKNGCSSATRSLSFIYGPATCSISADCRLLDCCLSMPLMKRSFHVMMDIDLCARTISLQIEKLKMELLMTDGKLVMEDKFKLIDTVIIDYKITRNHHVFIVDFNISIQFDQGLNMFHYVILKKTIFQQPLCNWNTGFQIHEFSLKNWLQNYNVSSEEVLTKAMTSSLIETLGIGNIIHSLSCERSLNKYSPSIHGWKSECPLSVSTSPLNIPATCVILSHCTAIDCCVDVEFLHRSFHVLFDLNVCNNTFTIGIDRLQLEPMNLTSIEYGKIHHFNMKGVIRIGYSIDDLPEQRKFLVNMNISVCFESDDPCLYDFVLFKDSLIPKILCDWESGFSIPGFSLNNFIQYYGYNTSDLLPQFLVNKLFQKLGISSYLMDNPCSLNDGIYFPSKNGWKNDCQYDLKLLKLPESAVCNLGQSCTSVNCCVKDNILRKTFNVWVDLDPCTYKLKFGIEKLSHEIDLFGYKWGTTERKYLMNVVRVEFILKDFIIERQFEIQMNISICLEEQSCSLNFTVFQESKLPKIFCDSGTGFLIPGFSFGGYLKRLGYLVTDSLPPEVTENLQTYLGLDTFLLKPDCQNVTSPYSVAQHTVENTVCPEDQKIVLFDSECNFGKMCSDIRCCVGVGLLHRALYISIDIDPCEYIMQLQVDSLHVKKSLFDYNWGVKDSISLQGGLIFQFIIDDLPSQKMFMIDLKLLVCLEANDPTDCIVNVDVFKNLKIRKKECNWNMGFKVKDFSLREWKHSRKIQRTDNLTKYDSYQLLDDLGIQKYLKTDECEVQPIIHEDLKGWIIHSNCKQPNNIQSFGNDLLCNITDKCTEIICCLFLEKLELSLDFFLTMDPCNNKFTIGVGKLTKSEYLLSFQFGVEEVFSLFGVLKLRYKIDDFQSEEAFVVALHISVCFETNMPCDMEFQMLKDVKLYKPVCDLDKKYAINNFSLSHWLVNENIVVGQTLPDYAVDLLTEQLGIAQYLHENQCTTRNIYHANNVWNTSGCKKTLTLAKLSRNIACGLPEYCTGATCCVNLPLLGRSIEVFVLLDVCNYKITIGIEMMIQEISLFDYIYNTWQNVTLGNMVRLGYRIEELSAEKMFLFDMKIDICFETTGDCRYSYIIFENTKLPRQPCDWSGGYAIPGFNLNQWLNDKNLPTTTTVLNSLMASHLLEDLDIADYMLYPSCDFNTFQVKQHDSLGWKSGTLNTCVFHTLRRKYK
ncbi:uncharacterized protein [Mytilus edulis]|uniref:uncharacterized protein n=1 Tax=Mytilus edulis TaxID=6550 RepID=UPI0039F0C62B